MKINLTGKPPKPKPTGPQIWHPEITRQEVMWRLIGGRRFMGITTGGIKGYNQTKLAEGYLEHLVTREDVEALLDSVGHPIALATQHGVGIPRVEKHRLLKARAEEKEKAKKKVEVPA